MADKSGWEESDFPILCETCLGDNPYVRMTKNRHGAECKICARPFTVFRWCPGKGMRFKKTEVCQTCAKLKNVCQTCLLDLEYGLPTQVRDKLLNISEQMPTSDVNKEYYIQNQEQMLANTDGTTPIGQLAEASGSTSGKMSAGKALLQQLARRRPYYKRNRAHICSFWVKGECKRGDSCPFRHEMPTDPNDPLSKQNLKDRYYGTSDPVADKILQKADALSEATKAPDETVKSIYIGGVTPESQIAEVDLRDHFYQFGEIRRVSLVPRLSSAFVDFVSHDAAQRAVDGSRGMVLKGHGLRVMWGRSRANPNPRGPSSESSAASSAAIAPQAAQLPPGFAPPPPGILPPPGMVAPGAIKYPSMDSTRMGAKTNSAKPSKSQQGPKA